MWFVYILRCADNTLYTGITTDLHQRLESHNAGTGAKYTRSRRPVELLYFEKSESHSQALKREYAIKQLPRVQKLRLINTAKSTENACNSSDEAV